VGNPLFIHHSSFIIPDFFPMSNRRTILWQGWMLQLPRRWDAVKLEGDFALGHALFADASRPRLGLRWRLLKKNADPEGAVIAALRAEVGQLAADEAKVIANGGELWESPVLYTEPKPPGRDVFVGYSYVSSRLLEVVYHASHRDNALASVILPTLADVPVERAVPWSIFDLSCVVPGGMPLRSHRLNAGDLGLTFADRYVCELTVRQIAIAKLALQRQPLDGWIADQQKLSRRYHQPTGVFSDAKLMLAGGEASGRMSRMSLRLRYCLLNQPRQLTTIALHDEPRDRLIVLHGSDESLLQVIAPSVGCLSAATFAGLE
jgi:hypothetical protein